MEADFVNAYIERLLSNVHDLTSKNILLETRVQFAEKKTAELQAELESLKKKPTKNGAAE